MNRLIGVRFEKCGRIHYFFTGEYNPEIGDRVVAESEMGLEVGEMVADNCDEASVRNDSPLQAILRVADSEDFIRLKENEELAKEAGDIFKEKTAFHGLDMKLIKVKYLFDRKKVLFYYYADDRVDFRALVRNLASVFHTRIELRQIGVREVARMVGAMGVCGRPCCCSSHMSGRSNVNIKMAKDQGIALNPAGLTGACGRLMCCLEHESKAYEELREGMPSNGDMVREKSGGRTGRIVGGNILLRKCKVLFEDEDGESEVSYLGADELEILRKRRGAQPEKSGYSRESVDEKELQDLTGE